MMLQSFKNLVGPELNALSTKVYSAFLGFAFITFSKKVMKANRRKADQPFD